MSIQGTIWSLRVQMSPDLRVIHAASLRMTRRKKKLTPEQKAAKKKRRDEYMTVFMNGKQKRIKRPYPLVDGIPADEFIRKNADPIFLHQNEMWEYIDQSDEQIEPIPDDLDIPF